MNFSVTEGRYVIMPIFKIFLAMKCGIFAYLFFSEKIQMQVTTYLSNENCMMVCCAVLEQVHTTSLIGQVQC